MPEPRKEEQTERGNRMNEERYLSLANDVLNTSVFGIFLLDSDFRVVWMNQTLEHYFGLRREDVVGKDVRNIIRERLKDVFEEPEIFAEKMLATYDNNTYIGNFECHVLPHAGSKERWLEYWSQPIPSGPYTIEGRIEYYVDVTKRKLVEEALRASRDRLETVFDAVADSLGSMDRSLDKRSLTPTLIDHIRGLTRLDIPMDGAGGEQGIDAKLKLHLEHLKELMEERISELLKAERMAALGEAATMIAHDLRNPLQDIRLAQHLLEKRCPHEQELLDHIDRCVEYADGIVENLLIYSGKRPLRFEEADINELLRCSIKESVIPKHIRVEDRLGRPLRVYVDPIQMKRVFLNLIVNAVQAMEDGGTLTVESRGAKDSVAISLQDTGVGFSETGLELIWRPFYSTKAKGMGLGLSVVKHIVEGHGGTVSLKSKVGEGSAFIVQIPVQAQYDTTLDLKTDQRDE